MADEQLTLNDLHRTETVNIRLARATKKTLTFDHDFGASTNITSWRYQWRKKSTDDANKTVVLSLTSTLNSDQMTLTASGKGNTLIIDDEDTRGLDYTLVYDHGLEMIGTGNVEQVPFVGDASLIYEVVDDDTSASPSWTALSVFNSNLEALLTCNIASVLAVDADATDGTITVEDASVFTAGDTITIADATNSESHDIAVGGISGNVITLDSTTLAEDYLADYAVVVKNF